MIPLPFRYIHHFPFLFPRFLDREINRFYFIFLLRNFAIGMIAIFEPIYYFKYFNHSISKVLLIYAILFAGVSLFCYWTVKIAAKIGLKHSIIISFPFILIYYFILWHIDLHPLLLPLALVNWLAAVLLFWMPVNIYFGIASNKDSLGFEISKFQMIFMLSFALGPVIGGLILAAFSWSALFLSVILILFITSLGLFFSPEIHESYNVSAKDLVKELFEKAFWSKAIAFAATGGEHVIKGFIWPVFLFVLGINYESIGIISAGALLVSVIFTLYAGLLSDRVPRSRLLAIGSILLSFSWILKTLVKTALNAFVVNVFYGITSAASAVPFMAIFYEDFARQRSQIIVLREIALNIGRVFVLAALAFFFLWSDKLYLAFFAAAFITPFFNLIYFRKS